MEQFVRRRLVRYVIAYAWLLIISTFTAFPFFWMLTSSFKARPEIFHADSCTFPQGTDPGQLQLCTHRDAGRALFSQQPLHCHRHDICWHWC